MPIDLRDGYPFFVTHKDFIAEYNGSFSEDCLNKHCLVKVRDTFNRLIESKTEKLKDKEHSKYFFAISGEDARYSFLELVVFFTHFYSKEFIVDDDNRRMLISEFRIPFKNRIMDWSKSYSICRGDLRFRVPLSKIMSIRGYPQYFIVDIIDCTLIFSNSNEGRERFNKISILPKSLNLPPKSSVEFNEYSNYLYKKNKYYVYESDVFKIDGSCYYIPDFYKPSVFNTLSFCGLTGFKDLYLVDYRHFSNFQGYYHHRITSCFD